MPLDSLPLSESGLARQIASLCYVYECIRISGTPFTNIKCQDCVQAKGRYVPLPWASVHWLVQCTLECHWNATGWPSVHWDTTGPSSEYLQGTLEHHRKKNNWNSPTLECHWRNLVESGTHMDATGETLTFAAYTGTPLEGLWQPTHAPTHIVKHAE